MGAPFLSNERRIWLRSGMVQNNAKYMVINQYWFDEIGKMAFIQSRKVICPSFIKQADKAVIRTE